MAMTKADIARNISENLDCSWKESTDIVESVLDIIKDTLVGGESVMISGFGIFELKNKRTRRGRNPQTGESISISARRVLTFKPSPILRRAMNE
jgi:integration host factor subunit alpha